MYQPSPRKQITKCLVLLALWCTSFVSAAVRKNLCGVSMHSSDFPDIGKFSTIEASWTIPEVMLQEGRFGQYVSNNIALCCVIMFEPLFQYFRIPSFMDIRFNSSNIVQTRLEVVSPTTAKVTFSKLLNSTSSETVSIDITIDQDNGHAVLHYTVTQNGKAYEETVLPWNNATKSASFCGDSAWWYLNDPDDPFHDAEMHNAIAPFSPVLMGGHKLGTTQGKQFPANLPLNPQAHFWDMVGDDGEELLCRVRGFVDAGVVLLQSLSLWGI